MAVIGAATSPQLLRRLNIEALVRFALKAPAFNASDAMSATSLTRSTVLGLCEELAEAGWITELDDARAAGAYSKGRPARRYTLRDDAGYILGVDAGAHRITAVATDLRGTPCARVERTISDEQPRQRAAAIAATIDATLTQAGITSKQLLTTVIGVPAPVDANGYSPVGHAGYWAHMNPELADSFPGHGRVVIENDANLAALAERAVGAGQDVSSFAALLSGERFGAGLIIDGTLIRGAHGGAGELRVLDLVDGIGSADGIGALARDWVRLARAKGTIPARSSLAQPPRDQLEATDVFRAAADGDRTALKIVERLGERLARVCIVLASLLDVQRIIVAGAIADGVGDVITRASAVLHDDFYEPIPDLVASALGPDVVSHGAVQHGLSLIQHDPLAFIDRVALPRSEQ